MPKISAERGASIFINAKCKEAVGDKGQYIGHKTDVSDDGKIAVYAYYVPGDSIDAKTLRINDKAVLRAAVNPASVPVKPKTEAATKK